MGHQPTGSSASALAARLSENEARIREGRDHQSALIAEAERRGLPAEMGALSTVAWVRDLLNIADDEAESLVEGARKHSSGTSPDH